MTIMDGNAVLNEIIGKWWMVMMLVYFILNTIFPDSKILKAIGEGFSKMFPVFRKKGE
jgi:hypothetical protein